MNLKVCDICGQDPRKAPESAVLHPDLPTGGDVQTVRINYRTLDLCNGCRNLPLSKVMAEPVDGANKEDLLQEFARYTLDRQDDRGRFPRPSPPRIPHIDDDWRRDNFQLICHGCAPSSMSALEEQRLIDEGHRALARFAEKLQQDAHDAAHPAIHSGDGSGASQKINPFVDPQGAFEQQYPEFQFGHPA